MARPTELTPVRQVRICNALRNGLSREAAARAGTVTYQTFLNWYKKGETETEGAHFDFYCAVDDAEAEFEYTTAEIAMRGVKGGLKAVTTKEMVKNTGEAEIYESTTITRTTLPDARLAVKLLQLRRHRDWGSKVSIKVGSDSLREQLSDLGIDWNELVTRIADEVVAVRRQRALTDRGGSQGESEGD